ncbi:MAG TPA: hypothetical protein DCY13_05210, partial [Verrucomicrobiales bacterium]|nr:hypothetical protein [Verrucomicrobiales bacterium]
MTRLLVVYLASVAVCSGIAVERIAPPVSELAAPADVRAKLEAGLDELADEIAKTRDAVYGNPGLGALLPDVLIFQKAVDWALRYGEFYHTNEFRTAHGLLDAGLDRARQLRSGVAPWTESSGLVVRGYVSRVDGSVQPYGLVVPDGWRKGTAQRFRLDVWLHGRDDKLTELKFLDQRQRQRGEFAPADAIVLHPYGRYCNAFKFAGETDVLEAMAAVRRHYPIDDRRLAIRGFSMGGGGTWHLAAHYPGTWVVAAPGAGFAESAEYLGKLTKEPFPPAWEQTMWGLYDATDYALNFFNLPLIAYSGRLDKQIQAAQIMEKHLGAAGMSLRHVIGDNIGHKYTPPAKEEISEYVHNIVALGKDTVPARIKFTTRTLRYPRSHWVVVEGMSKHWEPARVEAAIAEGRRIELETSGVTAFRLSFGAGELPVSLIAGGPNGRLGTVSV